MHSPNTPNYVGMLINPNSTGAKLEATKESIRNLEEAFPGRTYKIFTDKSYDITQDRIVEESHPDDIICGFGGDSLALNVANAFLRDDAPKGLKYKAFKAGNGSEVAKMTGSECGLSASEAILQGDVRPVRPIHLEWETPGEKPQIIRALAYFGLHTSAHVTRKMNDPAHRSHFLYKHRATRMIVEMCTTLGVGFTTPGLRLDRSGKITTVQELSFVNGDIMGKLGRIPNKLDRDGVYGVAIPAHANTIIERVAAASHGAISLLSGRTSGFDIMPSEAVSFTVLDDTYIHADGEPFPVAAGTKMTIGPDPRSIDVLFNEVAA